MMVVAATWVMLMFIFHAEFVIQHEQFLQYVKTAEGNNLCKCEKTWVSLLISLGEQNYGFFLSLFKESTLFL